MKKKRNPLKNVVGKKIRILRNQKNWSQENLATALQLLGWDCTRSRLAKIESGMIRVTDLQLLYLSKALKAALSDLFETANLMKISEDFKYHQ